MTNKEKLDAKEYYELTKTPWHKEWNDLTDDEKEEFYEKYVIKIKLLDEDGITYETWKDGELDTYYKGFKTEHGDEIVAFGTYEYN